MEMGGRAVPSFQLKAAEGPPGNPDPPSGPRMETWVDEVNGVWFTVCTLLNRKRKKSKKRKKQRGKLIEGLKLIYRVLMPIPIQWTTSWQWSQNWPCDLKKEREKILYLAEDACIFPVPRRIMLGCWRLTMGMSVRALPPTMRETVWRSCLYPSFKGLSSKVDQSTYLSWLTPDEIYA